MIFAGSPPFAAALLAALVETGYSIDLVLTQPPKPAGRHQKLTPTPVASYAHEKGIRVLTPATLLDPAIQETIARCRAPLMMVAAYGLLIPPAVLTLPTQGCVNLHTSLLPRWRGASPITQAILAGDEHTGIALMQMDEGLDTGPVYATLQCPILPNDTTGQLTERLLNLGKTLLQLYLPELLKGRLRATPQSPSGSTNAPKIRKADRIMNWTLPALQLERQVRAYQPWPVSATTTPEGLLQIHASQVAHPEEIRPHQGADPSPGTIRELSKERGVLVQTGEGALWLTALQKPGGKILGPEELWNGYRNRWVGEQWLP